MRIWTAVIDAADISKHIISVSIQRFCYFQQGCKRFKV